MKQRRKVVVKIVQTRYDQYKTTLLPPFDQHNRTNMTTRKRTTTENIKPASVSILESYIIVHKSEYPEEFSFPLYSNFEKIDLRQRRAEGHSGA